MSDQKTSYHIRAATGSNRDVYTLIVTFTHYRIDEALSTMATVAFKDQH